MQINTSFQHLIRKSFRIARLLSIIQGNRFYRYFANDDRLLRHVYALENTKHLNGLVAECGIGTGYSMVYILSYLKSKNDIRKYIGFDTFEGFPYIHEHDLKNLSRERKKISVIGHYKEYNFSYISKLAKYNNFYSKAVLEKGKFENTLQKYHDQKFSYVFLDCDLYQSYKTCLTFFYNRLQMGAYMVFDEYEHVKDWPGARKAIDEFFMDKVEKPKKFSFTTSYYITKE